MSSAGGILALASSAVVECLCERPGVVSGPLRLSGGFAGLTLEAGAQPGLPAGGVRGGILARPTLKSRDRCAAAALFGGELGLGDRGHTRPSLSRGVAGAQFRLT